MSESIPARDFGPVSPEKMKTMAALLQDPNPIHWDVDAVKKLGMGDRPVNQGPINMSLLVNTLTSWTDDPGALRELVIRYQANVFAGDVVHCEAVLESEADGLARCAVTASVDGKPVITGSATLARRR
jgi:acyl dehydratase